MLDWILRAESGSVGGGFEEVAGSSGAGENGFEGLVLAAVEFEDKHAVEVSAAEFAQEPGPVDAAIARGEVVVAMPVVVVHMHHFEVTGEFLNDDVQLAREVGVTGVEAGADLTRMDFSKQVHHVPDVAEEKVGQHVFQQQFDPELAAAGGDSVEGVRCVMHVPEELGLGRAAFAFGTGMQDDVGAAEAGGGLTGEDDFGDGGLAGCGVEGGDVDAVGEGGVEGNRVDLQLAQALSGALDGGAVMVIQVSRKGADFDLVEARRFDGGEDIEDGAAVKAAGGEGDGPFEHIHGGRRLSRALRDSVSEQVLSGGGKQKPFS